MRDVAFSCDDNGVRFLKVAVWSLLEHYRGKEPIRINVFEGWGGHSPESKKALQAIVDGFDESKSRVEVEERNCLGRGSVGNGQARDRFYTLRYVNVEEVVKPYEDVIMHRDNSRWNVFTWTPIFTPALLPDATGNVIHFDIDMLFNADVSPLFESIVQPSTSNHQPYLIACCYEYDKYGDNAGKVVWEKGILPPTVERYFNTGTLVFNVEECRKERTWDKIVGWYRDHYEIADRIEQDAWNALYHDRMRPLSVKWNFHDRAMKNYAKWDTSEKYWLGNPPRECLEAALDPAILHFWGPKKPWKVSHRPYRKLYHAAMAAVGQQPPREPFFAFWHNLMNKLVRNRIADRVDGTEVGDKSTLWSWRKFAVAGSLAAVIGIILPLQTFLGNSSIFPFSLARLIPELIGIAAVSTFALLLVSFLSEKLFSILHLHLSPSPFFFSVLAGVLVCVYLESGILSAGIPELNGGAVPELANRTRGIIDAGIWVAVIVGFALLAKKLRAYLHWIALAVLALSIAALVDVTVRAARGPCQDAGAADVEGRLAYEPQPTVVANAKYSSSRNILVFIMDSVPGLAGTDAICTNAELCAKLPGFVAYRNNIAMHDCTKRGVPGIVTGHYFDPEEMSEQDYPMTMYGTNSFVVAADAAGWNVAFSPDLLPYGATNLKVERRVAREEKRRSRDNFAFLRQSTEVPFLSLFDTVAFRLVPFLAKAPLLYSRIRHAVKGRHSAEGFWGEATLYPQLAARPINDDGRPFLGFFHSWGVHPPWRGDFASVVTPKFRELTRLMDAYRASGLYDKSLIIVTSDHGLLGAPTLEGYPTSASSLLWVKPEGATAPFAVSPKMTSHAGIAPLVRASLSSVQSSAACEAFLCDEHPLHRSEEREGSRDFFKDWRR